MKIVLIAAVARNGVIGDGHGLLWHLPEDLAFFRRATLGAPVIMGRRTWESLPPKFRPLPGRRNIVVSRNPAFRAEGAEAAASLDAAIALAGDSASTASAFVIGGGALYAAAMARAEELLLTEIDRDFEGDTRFPPWRDGFDEVSREAHRAALPNDFDFAFVRYIKRDIKSA